MTEMNKGPQLDPDQPGFGGPADPSAEPAQQVQEDYFGFSDTKQYFLPDGISYLTISIMNEGAKSKFQKKTQRDVVLARGSGDAKFTMDPAQERHELIIESVVDWNLLRNGQRVPLGTSSTNKQNLRDWLNLTNPVLVEDVEKYIRKLNPWLVGEITVADIDEQIEQLQEQREELLKRESGEGSSSSK